MTKLTKVILSQFLATLPRTCDLISVPQHSAPLDHWPTNNHPVILKYSAPLDHLHANNHPFTLKYFAIIISIATESDLRISQSLYVLKSRPSHNSNQSSVPLLIFQAKGIIIKKCT